MLDPRRFKPVKIDYSLPDRLREAQARARAVAAARHEEIVRQRKTRQQAYVAGKQAHS